MLLKFLLLLLLTGIFASAPAHASSREQKPSESSLHIPAPENVQIITTTDGSTMIGRITRVGETDIDFLTELGTVTIPKTKVRSIREVPASAIRNGKYWFDDPNRTRLLFAPTGRMLEKGRGYFADYYIFFPTINYGITDRVSFGAGTSLFPTGNLKDQIYYFTPKVGIRSSEKLDLAAGALVIHIPDIDDEDKSPLLSVIYGVGTYGGPDGSVTFGLGYGMVDARLADRPLIVLGGERRLSRRTAFVTENWVVPGVDRALVSYGVRFFTENLSVDLALLNSLGGGGIFPGIPYVDFVWNF